MVRVSRWSSFRSVHYLLKIKPNFVPTHPQKTKKQKTKTTKNKNKTKQNKTKQNRALVYWGKIFCVSYNIGFSIMCDIKKKKEHFFRADSDFGKTDVCEANNEWTDNIETVKAVSA